VALARGSRSAGRRGAHVAIGYTRGEAEAREVVAGIASRVAAPRWWALTWPIGPLPKRRFTEVAQRHGRLDILVSNAGITIDGCSPASVLRTSSRSGGERQGSLWHAPKQPSSP